jgi:hypothetical protein
MGLASPTLRHMVAQTGLPDDFVKSGRVRAVQELRSPGCPLHVTRIAERRIRMVRGRRHTSFT